MMTDSAPAIETRSKVRQVYECVNRTHVSDWEMANDEAIETMDSTARLAAAGAIAFVTITEDGRKVHISARHVVAAHVRVWDVLVDGDPF